MADEKRSITKARDEEKAQASQQPYFTHATKCYYTKANRNAALSPKLLYTAIILYITESDSSNIGACVGPFVGVSKNFVAKEMHFLVGVFLFD